MPGCTLNGSGAGTLLLQTLKVLKEQSLLNGGLPKIRGTILGVPIIRTIVFGGFILGPPFLGKKITDSLYPSPSPPS